MRILKNKRTGIRHIAFNDNDATLCRPRSWLSQQLFFGQWETIRDDITHCYASRYASCKRCKQILKNNY